MTVLQKLRCKVNTETVRKTIAYRDVRHNNIHINPYWLLPSAKSKTETHFHNKQRGPVPNGGFSTTSLVFWCWWGRQRRARRRRYHPRRRGEAVGTVYSAAKGRPRIRLTVSYQEWWKPPRPSPELSLHRIGRRAAVQGIGSTQLANK
jgi:hypothetical protein